MTTTHSTDEEPLTDFPVAAQLTGNKTDAEKYQRHRRLIIRVSGSLLAVVLAFDTVNLVSITVHFIAAAAGRWMDRAFMKRTAL